jgi:hypothetical protein
MRRGDSWKKGTGNPLRLIADKPRAHSRTHLPDCPANHVRVAIFTAAGALSHVKFAECIAGRVVVRLEGERHEASRCDVVPETGGARWRVTLPAHEEAA